MPDREAPFCLADRPEAGRIAPGAAGSGHGDAHGSAGVGHGDVHDSAKLQNPKKLEDFVMEPEFNLI